MWLCEADTQSEVGRRRRRVTTLLHRAEARPRSKSAATSLDSLDSVQRERERSCAMASEGLLEEGARGYEEGGRKRREGEGKGIARGEGGEA